MKKNELMNGDIVTLRKGSVAVVIGIGEEAYLVFQNSGFEFLDDYYNDDLVCEDFDDAIMQVFRNSGGFGFEAIDEETPIWERNENWVRPTAEECAAARFQMEKEQQEQLAETCAAAEDQKEHFIDVIAQQFYGNCTYTSIRRESIDFFLKGILSPELFNEETENVDRRIVRLPGFDNLVIVYDQIQEDRYVQVEFPELLAREGEYYRQRWGEELAMQVSCDIPEIDFKIHTRCFACRIDENGELQSLHPEDSASVINAFCGKQI